MTCAVPVYDFAAETVAFVENGLWQGKRHFGECTAIGFANAEEGLVGGVIYHDFDPDSGVIEMSAYASRHDLGTKSNLRILFDYPFNQLNLRMIVARCSEHNHRVRRIYKALGAREYLIPELRGAGEAEAIITLKRDTWTSSKFMKGTSYGKI